MGELGRSGGNKRRSVLTPERRKEIAKKAANARWHPGCPSKFPVAATGTSAPAERAAREPENHGTTEAGTPQATASSVDPI